VSAASFIPPSAQVRDMTSIAELRLALQSRLDGVFAEVRVAIGDPAYRIRRWLVPAGTWHECAICGACYDEPDDAARYCTRSSAAGRVHCVRWGLPAITRRRVMAA
jgi:hypothetical protein